VVTGGEFIPGRVLNWIAGREQAAAADETFVKLNPATGKQLCEVTRSRSNDVTVAVRAARAAYHEWRGLTPAARGDLLRGVALALRDKADEVSDVVHQETGKSRKDARGEVAAAVEMGFFVAGEGRRFYGRTTTSAVPHKAAMTVRQPLGVAGLIVPANTPIANVAWKVFPALLCGNTAVLTAAEDAPATAWLFANLAHGAGLPTGVLNVVQGFGDEAGAPLVESQAIDVVSFTGSYEVGRLIARAAADRVAKVCLELGGKNPLIVCDDADVERAASVAVLSAFSNAGQRCAAGSRLIVFDAVYERFRSTLVARTQQLRVGTGDDDDFGPVINERQLVNMLGAVERARAEGGRVLVGGDRLTSPAYAGGFYMAPTIIEPRGMDSEISRLEVFGPITCLYRARDYEEAIALANQSPYGLTAAIHTNSIHRAMEFLSRVETGVAVVNGATYGSEPHMPFGGLKHSGNGLREAGTEALDVYSAWKTVYINHDPLAT
jgi:aldehyde dehydrogenase (NAD+)